jgi:short-subunit dehydrogenase
VNLSGKRVLVTGASRGIGQGLAEALAREGTRLALLARSSDALEGLGEQLGARTYAVDLSHPEATRGLIERIEADGGPIDVLVNNAGVSHVNHVLRNSEEEIEAIFRINLLAPVLLCRQVIPRMLERGGGHIVNVSSLAAVLSPPGLVHYGASKAGLSHYTAGLRQDLRGRPIGITLVQLGSVPTDLDAMSRNYGPIRDLSARTARGNGKPPRDITPLPVVVAAIVAAIKQNRRHVRLPQAAVPLCMLVELPRRVTEWAFRNVDPWVPSD